MPAEKIWVYKNLHCMVSLVPLSHRCGYVGIPPSHPWFRISYEELPINIHGGLTYSSMNEYRDEQCGVVGLYWVGFDCNHAGDSNVNEVNPHGHIWTLDEVGIETNSMADQVDNAKDIIEFWLSKRMEKVSDLIWQMALKKYKKISTDDIAEPMNQLIEEIRSAVNPEPKSVVVKPAIRQLDLED